MLTVGDLMTRDVVTLDEADDLLRGDDLLKLHHIRHLPVVREGKLVGIVSHRDLIRALARRSTAARDVLVGVSDIMSRDVETVTPDVSARDASLRLLDHRFGCLPVVDGEGRLVGIVTEADFLRLCAKLLARLDREAEVGGEAGAPTS